MLIDEDRLRQVKFVNLFKVAVLNLHEIVMKPDITGSTNIIFLYFQDKLEIASLKGLTHRHPEINRSKRPLAWQCTILMT